MGPKKSPDRSGLRLLTNPSPRPSGALFFYNGGMLKPAAATAQTELEMVTLDQLVPRDHLLRLIDTHIRFDFIREKTEGLYFANNGRPAIDPVVLFKMQFIGYLFGVRSERQLVLEIEVNMAYRWFLGLRLTDKVPDASTLSQNRRRRFAGTGIEQAIEHKLIGGRVLYTDSTHLKANANKRHYEMADLEQTPAAYLAELDAAVDAERAAADQKPLRRAPAAPEPPNLPSRARVRTAASPPPPPSRCRTPRRRTPVRSSAARSTPTRASWCATRNPSASSIWTTAPSMACMH